MPREVEIDVWNIATLSLGLCVIVLLTIVLTPVYQRWRANTRVIEAQAEAQAISAVSGVLNDQYLQYMTAKEKCTN